MITRIVVAWSVMTAATGLASGFLSLFLVRLLFGMGEAGMFPGLARAFAAWIPGKSHGSIFGLSITAALLSGALTQKLVVWMLGWISWRWTFPIFGTVGILWAAAWYGWFRDEPRESVGLEAQDSPQQAVPASALPRPPVPWRKILFSRQLWALCLIYFGIIYGWYFYLTWMPDYLRRAEGLSPEHSANFAAFPLLSMAAAVFAGGYWSDRSCQRWGLVKGRKRCGLISLPLAILLVCGSVFFAKGMSAAILLGLAAGCASLSVASAWAASLDLGGHHSGVVSGAMNMFGNLGGALSPVVFGHCVQQWEVSRPWAAWHIPLLTTAACYLLSWICWCLLEVRRIEP
jgi:MFS family permease